MQWPTNVTQLPHGVLKMHYLETCHLPNYESEENE